MGNTICTPPNRASTYGREVDDKASAESVHPMPSSVAVTIAIKAQLAISTSIDNSLRKEKFEHSRRVKILLLGGADAGKSTILKQMRILHMTGFSELEMHSFYNYLRFNVFEIFHEIAMGLQENILAVSEDEKLMIYRFAEGISWFIGIEDEIETQYLLNFLELESVQTFMKLHPNYASLPDNAHYYLPKLHKLLAPEHIPTAEDILHLRIPTTGVSEINFEFSANAIRLIDVGGQRTYRKKWIHCFDGVAAVLFVASLAAYDQALEGVDIDSKPVLHRDLFPPVEQSEKRVNRLRDSVKLFGEMLRCRFLRSSSFILFLNKTDLFAKKLPLSPLSEHFSSYDGTTNEQASEYLKDQFLKRKSKNDTERTIYSHYTCATDTNNVEFVFKAACDIVFQRNLHTTGAQ